MMSKLKSFQELQALRKKLSGEQHRDRPTIVVSNGTCGRSRGSDKVYAAFEAGIKERKLEDKVNLRDSGCHGFCQAEPNVVILPGIRCPESGAAPDSPSSDSGLPKGFPSSDDGVFYANLKPEDAAEILDETIKNGKVVDRLLYEDPGTGSRAAKLREMSFYRKQNRLVSGRNLQFDPTRIEDYLAIGGYSGLAKALGMEPNAVTDEVFKSGLRGRGGGGFPTGVKWQRVGAGKEKYIICNADEGDPGAYMDRSLLEGNPHGVLEGMVIGAYAIGATQGVIYVRTEYPLAVANVTGAIESARKLGLLGKDILGSGFSFDITIARGAGELTDAAAARSIFSPAPPLPCRKGCPALPSEVSP